MENCPICLEEMSHSCVTLECSHKFDLMCILKHKDINQDATCPMCRRVSYIFKKINDEIIKNKLKRIKRHYRRSLLALRILIDADDEQTNPEDLQSILSNTVEMYIDMMWEDMEDDNILPQLFAEPVEYTEEANPEPSE